MIFMTSIISVFANCLKFLEIFWIFSPLLCLSLTKERSHWIINNFLVNLSRNFSCLAEDFLDFWNYLV